MIFWIFSPKHLKFFTQNKAKLFNNLITTVVVEKKPANFIAENCQKSPKIVIITSTPDMKMVWSNRFVDFTKNHRNWRFGDCKLLYFTTKKRVSWYQSICLFYFPTITHKRVILSSIYKHNSMVMFYLAGSTMCHVKQLLKFWVHF
jgi:hypothetical protein